MQCGHFQSRKHLTTRWNLKNCQVQCVGCNMFKAGEQYKFSLALDSKYGEGISEELEILAKGTWKITRAEYEDFSAYYKAAVEKLKKEKGIE